MAGGRPTRLVSIVQQTLATGPVPQEQLIRSLQQSGIRVDLGVLWETCRTHGLADLRDDVWVPRGWAAPVGEPGGAVFTSPDRRRDRLARRVDAQVRRLAEEVGLGEPEPVPPVGPVPVGWDEVVRGAGRALADELARVTARRTETDVPLGLALGAAFGVLVYYYGLGRSGSNLGAGSVGIAVIIGLITAAGGAWSVFRKGW